MFEVAEVETLQLEIEKYARSLMTVGYVSPPAYPGDRLRRLAAGRNSGMDG
jgi:hypothetical protein